MQYSISLILEIFWALVTSKYQNVSLKIEVVLFHKQAERVL